MIVKEFSNVSKFMGGAKHRVDSVVPWSGSPMQPLVSAQSFGGPGRGQFMYPTAPAWTNPGVPGR